VSVDGEHAVEHLAELAIVTVRGGAEYARVILRGDLDHPAAQRLRIELGAVLDSGARYLTVDLADANGCDESALDALGWAACRASFQQGWLALTGVNRHLRFAAEGHQLRHR
jgi:anti-anti-sigma regulatory factor